MKKTIIGLTGQSGAGKSTVASIFAQNGFFVVDADKVAREVSCDTSVLERLSATFGEDVIVDGALDRKALGAIVFADKAQLAKLNAIMHPAICSKMLQMSENCDSEYVLFDAPQLFEGGLDKHCDDIVSVIAPHHILVKRIVARDGISKEMAEKRIASQHTQEFFKKNSTYIIQSTRDLQWLKQTVESLIVCIKRQFDKDAPW